MKPISLKMMIPLKKKPNFLSFLFPTYHWSLIIFPYTSEKTDNSEFENVQLQTNHETNLSDFKQSLKKLFFVPSLFKYTSKFNGIFSPADTPFIIGKNLKYQKRDPVMKIVFSRITKN